MDSSKKVKKEEAGDGGAGSSGGGDGGKPSKKIKTEDGDDNDDDNGEGGGGGGGSGDSSGGSGNPSIRAGGANAPPLKDLVLVGKILDNPAPEYEAASGGRMMKVTAETWMTDLYRCNEWWIALPNVEDVGDINRRRLMIKVIPLGAPRTSFLVGVESGSQGRMRMEAIKLALFLSDRNRGAWNVIAGTAPAWFANVWDKSKTRQHPSECDQLANEFKNAKIYVTKNQVLQQQRDWLVV